MLVHGVDDDLAAELLRDFFQILLVLGGEDDVADAARNPGEHLFLDAAHGQDAPRRVISPSCRCRRARSFRSARR